MIIGACGFGETGSSVITDYLKEFDGITVYDNFEFAYVSGLDGLIDLERAVMHPHCRTVDSIYAIMRFDEMVDRNVHDFKLRGLPPERFLQSANNFIDSITMAKWYWEDRRKKSRRNIMYFIRRLVQLKYIPRWEMKNGCRYKGWPLDEVRLSVNPEFFYNAAQKHVDEILQGLGINQDDRIVLDQPFSGNNPQACFPFFKNPYAIVVDRDPRDLYVYGKTKLMGKFRFFPIDTVEEFISYYRCLRNKQPYSEPNPRVLNVRFEEMIYQYDETTEKIREFLNLPQNPRPKSIFKPSMSIVNTQVFKRYSQFYDDVKKIEDALSDYLFDFSKYPEPDFNQRMFVGRSPLNSRFKQSHDLEGYVPQSK